jgi:hypothetical protein
MSTWQERLKVAIGPRGYDGCMRRSLQTVLLYEAKRCIEPKLQSLRPFQRKSAHIDQMLALLESLTFVLPHQKEEIMWRTGSSKEPLTAEIAWKRAKSVDNELEKLAKALKPFIVAGKTHNEIVDLLVQSLFEGLINFVGKPYPTNWEHAHNHVILAFRMYYRYDQLDPTFPPPISPREIVVPNSREKTLPFTMKKMLPSGIHFNDDSSAYGVNMLLNESNATVAVATKLPVRPTTEEQSMSERRMALQEVREHLELLKEFEGVVPDEELANRKRELFLALPPAPTMAHFSSPDGKKYKVDSNETANGI